MEFVALFLIIVILLVILSKAKNTTHLEAPYELIEPFRNKEQVFSGTESAFYPE